MTTTLIYHLPNVLIPLEVEVIRAVVDLKSMPITRSTVQRLKTAWLEDRMEEMLMMFFHANNVKSLDAETFYRIKNLLHELDPPLYNGILIPEQFRCKYATVEIRYDDVYLYVS